MSRLELNPVLSALLSACCLVQDAMRSRTAHCFQETAGEQRNQKQRTMEDSRPQLQFK
jgi:hypothetical protein